jgi:hypothetical protein
MLIAGSITYYLAPPPAIQASSAPHFNPAAAAARVLQRG